MESAQIGKAYDQITHLWTDNEFNMSNGIEQHKKALTFVHKPGKALDIGCGCTGRFIDLLLGEGFTPVGIDVSFQMAQLAARRNPAVEIIHADICDYPLVDKYDFITAWDSLWHIPLTRQHDVLSKIISSLNPGGVLILSFGGVNKAQEHIDNNMGPEVYYSSLGTSGFLSLFTRLECEIKHLEFDQYPEPHAYLIVQRN